MILIIYAHPYPRHSHANQRLLQAVRDLPEVEVRSLYELYPDFNIDINAEQQALERADLVVLQHPMQWYSFPPLLTGNLHKNTILLRSDSMNASIATVIECPDVPPAGEYVG